MNVLLFGDTTGTHALTWKLFDSPRVEQIICAPGNGGTNSVFAFDMDLEPGDDSGTANFMFSADIDLAIANEEAVLAGLWDTAQALNKPVLGAGRALGPLLTSRVALREWVGRHNVPALRGRWFTHVDDAEKYAAAQPLPVQISSDDRHGAAITCHDRSELQAAITHCLREGTAQGERGVLVEEAPTVPVVIASWLSDSLSHVMLPPVRIYPLHDQLSNPAAGAHSDSTAVWQRLERVLEKQIVGPVERALRADGFPIRGWVSAECLVARRGPVLTRLSVTPHDQAVAALLPRLGSDLAPLLQATAGQTLGNVAPLIWAKPASAAVLIYSNAWPAGATGQAVVGLERLDPPALVFHHNTHNSQGLRYNPAGRSSLLPQLFSVKQDKPRGITTTGPLILTVAAAGAELAPARSAVYSMLGRIQVAGSIYREDVGLREL